MPSDKNGAGLTTMAPVVTVPDVNRAVRVPEFLPMPQGKNVEPYSGLKRGAMNLLCIPLAGNKYRPPVKSVTTRRPGCNRGTRLIVAEGHFGEQMGLLTYLRSLVSQQSANTVSTK